MDKTSPVFLFDMETSIEDNARILTKRTVHRYNKNLTSFKHYYTNHLLLLFLATGMTFLLAWIASFGWMLIVGLWCTSMLFLFTIILFDQSHGSASELLRDPAQVAFIDSFHDYSPVDMNKIGEEVWEKLRQRHEKRVAYYKEKGFESTDFAFARAMAIDALSLVFERPEY